MFHRINMTRWVLWLFVVLVIRSSCAWLPHFLTNHPGGGGAGDGGMRFHHHDGSSSGGGDDGEVSSRWAPSTRLEDWEEDMSQRQETPKHNENARLLRTTIVEEVGRGGATSNPKVIKGSKKTLSTTASFWSNAWKSTTQRVNNAFQGASNTLGGIFKSKEEKEEEALMKKLRTTPIRAVTAPNSTVLPPDVVEMAAKRSNMMGRPLRVETVQEMARNIRQWYTRKGYVLHSVTGATLQPDSATAELTVQEPKLSIHPVGITFCKEMVIDDDGSLVSYRQYRQKHSLRRSFGHSKIDKSDLNTTFVKTNGRTDPERLAHVLKLKPGRPFQWDGSRWKAITSSGIFSRILRASPEPMRDGTVQLQILATEAPPRNLEYGISKSLYTGSWEGEIDFEHRNLFGGGESLGLVVRRGTKDAEPSVRVQYSDDKFGLEGGYDLEIFSDFIGESETPGESKDTSQVGQDDLLDRRGVSVRLRNPFNPRVIRHSSASACLERASTIQGHRESIASATVGVGPFRKELPFDARSQVLAKLTSGTRVAEEAQTKQDSSSSDLSGYRIKPYSTATATTRQVFPLTEGAGRRPVSLALQHSITGSTFNLPRHEANALGHAATLRGYTSHSNGPIAASVSGTTEIRIPVKLPTDKTEQDASVVIFGDWLFAKAKPNSPFFRKSSVGIGVRKSLQGIPVKYDVSLTEDGKIGAAFGLGPDFDA